MPLNGFEKFTTYDSLNIGEVSISQLFSNSRNPGLVQLSKVSIPKRLQELAETRYGQREFLSTLFELAIEEQWFDLQHMIQHDMAKAIIADYSQEQGKDYLNQDIYFSCWEDVIDIGWKKFCVHTGLSRAKVDGKLQKLRDAI